MSSWHSCGEFDGVIEMFLLPWRPMSNLIMPRSMASVLVAIVHRR